MWLIAIVHFYLSIFGWISLSVLVTYSLGSFTNSMYSCCSNYTMQIKYNCNSGTPQRLCMVLKSYHVCMNALLHSVSTRIELTFTKAGFSGSRIVFAVYRTPSMAVTVISMMRSTTTNIRTMTAKCQSFRSCKFGVISQLINCGRDNHSYRCVIVCNASRVDVRALTPHKSLVSCTVFSSKMARIILLGVGRRAVLGRGWWWWW